MRQTRRLVPLLTLSAGIAAAVLLSTLPAGAQEASAPTPAPAVYNPYPPGILPSNVNSELARVLREVAVIENEAIKQWHAAPPPVLTGQPPTLQGGGYDAVRILGKLMNFDRNISPLKDIACASCHMPYAAFSGPIPSVNLTMVAYPGSVRFRAGKRTAQRYTYSSDFPVLNYNTTQAALFGGNFWDARATGYLLQTPAGEQAQHPPVDTQEMAMPVTACIAFRLSTAVYKPLFEEIWGADSLNISFPSNTEQICDTPGGAAIFGTNTTPVMLSPEDRERQIPFTITGARHFPSMKPLRMSARSRPSSTPSSPANILSLQPSWPVTNCSVARRTATPAIWMAVPPHLRLRLRKGSHRPAKTPAQQPPRGRSSLVSATPTSDYPRIPATPFTINQHQTPSDSPPIREALPTPISDWELFCAAVSAPRPTRTQPGDRSQRRPMARCRPAPRAT